MVHSLHGVPRRDTALAEAGELPNGAEFTCPALIQHLATSIGSFRPIGDIEEPLESRSKAPEFVKHLMALSLVDLRDGRKSRIDHTLVEKAPIAIHARHHAIKR